MTTVDKTIPGSSVRRIAGVVALALLIVGAFYWRIGSDMSWTMFLSRSGEKTLYWRAPLHFSDGAALDAERDISSFEIYINDTGNFSETDTARFSCPGTDPATKRPVNSLDLSRIRPPLEAGKTYYLTMKAVGRDGSRSPFSRPPLRFNY